jgi:TPR repeat protein
MTGLANCYSRGTGVAVDFAKAVALFTRAAEAGNAFAQYNLGVRYLEGSRGVARDAAKACDLIARSAAGGCAEAIEHLKSL